MFSFILITDRNIDKDILECFKCLGSVQLQESSGLYVEFKDKFLNGWISYLPSKDILDVVA